MKKLPCIHIHGVEKVLLSLHYTPEDAAASFNLFLVVLAFIFFFVDKDIPEWDRSTKTFLANMKIIMIIIIIIIIDMASFLAARLDFQIL